jgi:hypothetical protein
MKRIPSIVLPVCLLLFFMCNRVSAQQVTEKKLLQETILKKINDADLKSKEISKEVTIPVDGAIYIENASRNITVKTWAKQQVKVTTTVYYEGESKLTDEEWMEKVNLSLKTLGSSVKIKSGTVMANGFSYSGASGSYTSVSGTLSPSNNINAVNIGNGNGVAVFDGNGQNIGTKYNIKRLVTVMVPEGVKMDIESKYADVILPTKLGGDLTLDVSNGNLEAGSINKLTIRSKYGNINVIDVKNADIQLTNGRFSANNIDELDMETRASSVEIASVKKLAMNSSNDEYEFEEVGEIHGKKDFGSLRITKLLTSIEMNGSSSDVKIRNLGPQVKLIKIDDRFANIRIPMAQTKNYAVDFTGAYSSVYGNFEKKEIAGSAQPTITTVGTLTNTNNVKGQLVAGTLMNPEMLYTTSNGDKIIVSGIKLEPSTNNGMVSDTALTYVTGNNRLNRITTLGTMNAITVSGSIPAVAGSGTLTALSVTGYITSAGSANTITAQTVPITTVGRLSNLTVTGVITAGTISGIIGPGSRYVSGQLMPNSGATISSLGNYRTNPINNDTPSRFTATVGDGKGLKIDIKCQNCTVDFK